MMANSWVTLKYVYIVQRIAKVSTFTYTHWIETRAWD